VPFSSCTLARGTTIGESIKLGLFVSISLVVSVALAELKIPETNKMDRQVKSVETDLMRAREINVSPQPIVY